MIKHVIFDLDDTLCDFAGARKRGLDAAFSFLAPELRETAGELWQKLEPPLYLQFSRGILSREGYRSLRFTAILSTLGDSHLVFRPETELSALDAFGAAEKMNRAFMAEVNDRISAVNGAVECLSSLAEQGIGRHILTNGPSDGQMRKLKITGLASLVDQLFVSETLGVAKPDPEIFRIALERLCASPDQVVMVGDSLENDIVPARFLGIHALLYAPTRPAANDGSIHNLSEVPRYVDSFML